MTTMNSIINNGDVTGKIKNVYKFIEKHEKDIINIFETVYKDISSIFSDTTKDEDSITIIITESDSIDSVHCMVNDMIQKHTKDILGNNNGHITQYVFKTAIVDKAVTILLKK